MRILILMITLVFLFVGPSVQAETSDLEAQVLQIIRDHPEVIIESVQSYELKQRQIRQNKQQAALQQFSSQQLVGNSPTKGASSNKTLLIEFSDFECPFCARAAGDVQRFVEQHKTQVKFVYKHFPLTEIHDQAQPAALAAWAAQQQGQFWPYHDALFAEQSQLGEPLYLEIAGQLNLDMVKFNRDRNSPQATAAIRADVELGEQIGISGTPFFIFNGQVLDLPLDTQALETLL